MSTQFNRFKAWSWAAYTCLFGAVLGYVMFGGARAEIYLWIVVALVGSLLLVIKNTKIAIAAIRRSAQLADVGIIFLFALIEYIIPPSVGLLKAVAVLIVMALYLSMYMNALYQGKLGFAPTPAPGK